MTANRLLSSTLARRQLMRRAMAIAGAAISTPILSRPVFGQPRFIDHPFQLGVASGNPVADGMVLWTRLAPSPLDGGGMGAEAVPVRWMIATDDGMQNVVQSGVELAAPEHGHSVHVHVAGLDPDRWYWYRFDTGAEESPVGRTRTFPIVGSPAERMRFAYGSCQNFYQGYFNSYRNMVENDNLDLVFSLGDYIYESTWGPQVRWHLPEPYTLVDYRNHHALYKSDADMQRAHAAYPWAVTWDDHEVDNDYAGLNQEDLDPVDDFTMRRAAAYKAYYEHMPLWPLSRPNGPDMRLYTNLNFGDLASFMVVDNRQYRDDQACQGPSDFGGQNVPANCAERLDQARSMLGDDQERWLTGGLSNSLGRWNIVAQQMLFSPLRRGDNSWSDGWDGYPATRQRIVDHVVEEEIPNVVLIGGDIHQFWVSDVLADYDNPESPIVATEFVGSSISSTSSPWAEGFLPENPHIRFHDWAHRGYGRAELTPERMQMDLVAMESVADPNAPAFTLRSYVVENGVAGAQDA